MGTYHKYGYLYGLTIATKLQAECDAAKEALEERRPLVSEQDIKEFDANYWHAMRVFAYAKAPDDVTDPTPP